MKKFTLVALAMMASASCFAQTTFWDGEHSNIGADHTSNGFWDRCNPVVVENPDQGGINTSKKCVKFTISGNDANNGGIVLPINNGLDMSTNKRLSIMIRKPLWSNVQIELSAGTGTYWHRIAANYGGDNVGKWQKLVFDFSNYDNDLRTKHPTELAIYPILESGQTDPQEIYVDNIVLEDNPTVNGSPLKGATDGSLKGDLNLTGSYFKTNYFIVNPWEEKTIDDFVELNNKLSANVTSIDMRKASTLGVDINKFFEGKNPNTIVYANESYNHANVVVNGTANRLELTDENEYAFNAPEGFTATTVYLKRKVWSGTNSFVLPFAVTAGELEANWLATFSSYDKDGDKKAYFNKVEEVEEVEANTPFLAEIYGEQIELNFGEKDIVATPTDFGKDKDFVGVYAHQTAEGKYGIDNNNMLHKGGAGATIDAFHAYLNVPEVLGVAFNGSTPTAINGVAADKTVNTAVYDLSGRRVYGKLQKGLYIMNGKKFVVK